jgi:hypothetical protein
VIRISAAERRQLLVRRHHLHGDAPSVEEVATSLVGLHATEPASVHLAVLPRDLIPVVQAAAGVPVRLRTAIPPRLPSDIRQPVTSFLLALMGAEGRIVRGTTAGDWTSRRHRWEPVRVFWPDGLPVLDVEAARRSHVRSSARPRPLPRGVSAATSRDFVTAGATATDQASFVTMQA